MEDCQGGQRSRLTGGVCLLHLTIFMACDWGLKLGVAGLDAWPSANTFHRQAGRPQGYLAMGTRQPRGSGCSYHFIGYGICELNTCSSFCLGWTFELMTQP